MAKRPLEDAEEVEVRSTAELRQWLADHHTRPSGVWLVTFKKLAGDLYVSTGEIIDECLCFGWVDSLSRGKDDQRTMLWISPRKAGSNWSRVNKTKVAQLEAKGLMTPAGRAVIDRAKADGTWTALDDVENLIVPKDLGAALGAEPGAEDAWHALPRSVKRGALEQLLNAKRDTTRAKRIAHILAALAAGGRPFEWKPSDRD